MKNISSMAALAALLLVSCGQDTDVKFAGDEGAKVTFSASINEQNSQDVSRVTGVTWDDGDYGAQNETYIEGWEKKTSKLLIYKRLCKI